MFYLIMVDYSLLLLFFVPLHLGLDHCELLCVLPLTVPLVFRHLPDNQGYLGLLSEPGQVLTALVVCYHSFLSQSIAILELRRVMRDWVALFTYFLGTETFSSFTKVFGVAEPENQSPGLANLIRFSRLLNSKPSWVLGNNNLVPDRVLSLANCGKIFRAFHVTSSRQPGLCREL